RVNSQDERISIARMKSPTGWQEPGQRPDFLEVTCVLGGELRVESGHGVIDVPAGQAIITEPGQWVRYSTHHAEGDDYISVCLPAFSLETVHRDPSEEFDRPTSDGAGTGPRYVAAPITVEAAGNKPIRIDEFVGLINTQDERIS